MRYFFILGSNPVLSCAEIIALLDGRYFTVTEMYKQAVIVDAVGDQTLDAKKLMDRLGGTVKIGTIMEEGEPFTPEELQNLMMAGLAQRVASVGNATFGLSVYSMMSEQPANHAAAVSMRYKDVGMNVKRRLKEAGCAARWVKAQTGPALSSASVGNNQLLRDGAEFVVLAKKDGYLFGRTDVIQPYEQFSEVDYGRPERDTVQGMLPPKLARVMINLIHVSREVKDVTIMDPFCGSGTILTEALQMGFQKLRGSDKNPVAVESTLKNIAWLKEKKIIAAEGEEVSVVTADARNLRQHVPLRSLDAIVSELYLGPPQRGGERRGDLQKSLSELTRLYYEALSSWRPLLKAGAPVVLALPVFIMGMERHGIVTKEFEGLGFTTESLLPAPILARMGTRETKNKGLLYGRNDQRVWREIVRFRME